MPRKKKQVDTENAAVVRRGDYAKILKEIMDGGFCPFCEEHLFKHHRRPLLLRSKYWIVTENAWPYSGSRFHFLFIARLHVEATENVSPIMWADLQKAYRTLIKKNKMDGATLMIRSGNTKITGASVSHLHANLIAGVNRTQNTKPIKALVSFKK